VKGKEIVKIIDEWLYENNYHPDDLDSLFANELLERMEADE
jgi:hypothetical protein